MASVNEQIVREYFETLGFWVRQPRKYQVIARAKGPAEEVDFLALNPNAPREGERPAAGVWGVAELARVSAVAVAVRGWHTEKFTAAMLAGSPEVYRFAGAEARRAVTGETGLEGTAFVLCMADLPTAKEPREEALAFLKGQGIDGVLLFRPMLLELAARVDVKKNYERSDALQMLRILKNHGLLRSAQMDLFATRPRTRAATGGRAAEPAGEEVIAPDLEHTAVESAPPENAPTESAAPPESASVESVPLENAPAQDKEEV